MIIVHSMTVIKRSVVLWFRTRTSDRFFWTWYWTLVFRKRRGTLDQV